VNLSGLSGETGVSSTTLAEWLSALDASFLEFRLQPHFSNISKRTVKSPKFYFTEVGLAAYLLELESSLHVSRDPLRGNLFENMVVSDVMISRLNRGKYPRLFFLRTEKGFEIDLLVQEGRSLRPIEIKSASANCIHMCTGSSRSLSAPLTPEFAMYQARLRSVGVSGVVYSTPGVDGGHRKSYDRAVFRSGRESRTGVQERMRLY
jgi:predicted AAA+ superfamily ATPase